MWNHSGHHKNGLLTFLLLIDNLLVVCTPFRVFHSSICRTLHPKLYQSRPFCHQRCRSCYFWLFLARKSWSKHNSGRYWRRYWCNYLQPSRIRASKCRLGLSDKDTRAYQCISRRSIFEKRSIFSANHSRSFPSTVECLCRDQTIDIPSASCDTIHDRRENTQICKLSLPWLSSNRHILS